MTATVTAPPSGWLARHRQMLMVQGFLSVALVAGLLWALDQFVRSATAEQKAAATIAASSYANRLSNALNARLSLVRGLGAFTTVAAMGGSLDDQFPAFAALLVDAAAGVRDICAAPGFVIRQAFPAGALERKLGADLLRDERPGFAEAVQRAVRTREVVVQAPVPLAGGGAGLIARSAVFIDNRPWGVVSIAFDLAPILDEAALTVPAGPVPLAVAVRTRQGDALYGDPALFAADPIIDRIGIPDGGWELAVAPVGGWSAAIRADGTYMRVLVALIALALLAELVLFLLMERRVALERLVVERTAELAEARRTADRRANDLERFAYVAAHDLQEPLRTVSSFIQLLAKRLGDRLDEESASYVAQSIDATRRLKALLRDVQLFLAEEKIPLPAAPIQVQEVLAEVMAGLGERVRATGATIVHGPLPMVMADRRRLREILTVLLSNAMQHRDPTRPPEIAVTAADEDGTVLLTVADNGIGINARYADQVFEVFRRLGPRDDASGSGTGTGMGLAIARKMAERLGGRIDFVSEPGKGSAFTVRLPASRP